VSQSRRLRELHLRLRRRHRTEFVRLLLLRHLVSTKRLFTALGAEEIERLDKLAEARGVSREGMLVAVICAGMDELEAPPASCGRSRRAP
jgi:hypothetical protein